MWEVFAGFISGFALALITTPVLAVWIVSSRRALPFVARALPQGVPTLLITVPAANVAFLFWTGMGIIMGLLLKGANDATPQGALGSPNGLYSVGVVVLAVVLFLPPVVVVRPARPLLLFFAVLFVVAFGWVTPFLAEAAAD